MDVIFIDAHFNALIHPFPLSLQLPSPHTQPGLRGYHTKALMNPSNHRGSFSVTVVKHENILSPAVFGNWTTLYPLPSPRTDLSWSTLFVYHHILSSGFISNSMPLFWQLGLTRFGIKHSYLGLRSRAKRHFYTNEHLFCSHEYKISSIHTVK